MSNTNSNPYFLQGGGEMGELIRAKDWSKTSLGDPSVWPQSLRTMVAVMLDNPFGMYIAWGKEYLQLYNDGYRPILGTTKHPHALGISTRETFSEIWHIIESMFDGVMQGNAVGYPDLMLPLNRNGFVEECYFDFSYSPIRLDDGTVGGVLVTVIETTEKKRATEALKESNKRFINNIMQAPVAMCIFRGKNHVVEITNTHMLNLWGVDLEQVINKPIFEGLPEAKNQGLEEVMDNVYSTGVKFEANERPVNLPRNGKIETIFVNFIYDAIKEPNGNISGILAIATEVTAQVMARTRIEESINKVSSIVENAPFPIAVYVGKDMIVELANQSIIDIWGKGNDVIGKSFKTILPELDNQMVFEQIENVFNTGIAFHTKNTLLNLFIDGKLRSFYFNYSFTPLIDTAGNIYGVMNTGVDLTDLNIAKTKVEESEENIRSMVLQSPIGICVVDADTQVPEIVNDSFIEIAGKTYEEIAGKKYWDTFSEAKTYYEASFNNVVKEGKSFYANEVELNLIRHGIEEIIYVTFVYAPLKNIEGKVTKVAVWVLDNTAQVIARQKVEEADKKFRTTVKQAPVGITILRGPEYIVEMANDAYLHLVDRNEGEFVGRPLFDGLPEVENSVRSLLEGVLRTGIPYHGNEVGIPIIRGGQQELGYFDFLYYPLTEDDGSISGIIVTVTEVSENVKSRRKIEQNEERLKIVVEASELGTWTLNLKTMVPQYSQRYLEILRGYKSDSQLTHDQLMKYLHPDDLKVREKAFKDAISTGILHYEARLIWDDKSIHWMEGKGKVFYDVDKVPEKIVGTIRDITAEKKHRQELEESEQRFRDLIMQSPVAKAILRGSEHIVEMANDALLNEIWRKNESQVIGKKISDIFPELKEQKYLALLDEVYSTGEKYTEKEAFISLNGNDELKNYYVDFEYAPILSETGEISGIKITAIDVTEKVEARKKIEESEERFRSLAQTLPQLTWVTDENGILEFTSTKWKEFTGIEPTGEIEWKTIVHEDDFEGINAHWMHCLKTGELYSYDVRLRSKDGEYRWFAVKGEPILDRENNILKWVGAFTDINDQKIREEKKDEFISIASHEMKTPLTTAKAYLQMLELMLNENDGDAGLYAKKASQSVSRLNELIGELLDVSKIRLGKLNYAISTFNFDEMINSTVENIQLTSTTHTIIKSGKGNNEITGDKDRLQQVVINLLTNAIKYSPESDKVFVHIEAASNSITVSVKDTGIGIAQKSLNKIFEKYHRVEEHAVHYQGLGIGLFISYEIIQRHHGKLWAESEPGKGSTFYFTIPIGNISQ